MSASPFAALPSSNECLSSRLRNVADKLCKTDRRYEGSIMHGFAIMAEDLEKKVERLTASDLERSR